MTRDLGFAITICQVRHKKALSIGGKPFSGTAIKRIKQKLPDRTLG